MTILAENLEYLRLNAFEFSLEINPDAGYHQTIAERLVENTSLPDREDDWISPEQRAEAYRTGRYVEGRVYPNGSVSFYVSRGTSVDDVVAECAECCRQDQERYRAGGHEPGGKDGPAFKACEIPA